jgi:hypothetical protein
VRGLVEKVHDRLTDERFIGAEELQPRRIGIDDDAFLNLNDRVVRALQDYFQLAARVMSRFEGAVQGAFESERTQLAQNHRLQTRRISQRNKIACAELHGVRNAGLVGSFGDADNGKLGCYLVAYRNDTAQIFAADHMYQQFRVYLSDRVSEVA